jgi:hypothetical protein
MQGYLFARPLDAHAVQELLLSRMLDANAVATHDAFDGGMYRAG